MSAFKIVIFILCVTSQLEAQGQIANDKWAIGGELTLPSGRRNKPYKEFLNGLVSVHPKLQYKPFKNWYFALGPRYQYFTVAEFKVPEKMNGGLHSYGGQFEFGYMHFPNKRIQMQYGLRTGYQLNQYITDLTKTRGAQSNESVYFEPAISLGVISDEAVVYHWILSYSFATEPFKGEYLGLETFGGYKPADFEGITQSIYVGFGISFYFNNERSDTDFDSGE